MLDMTPGALQRKRAHGRSLADFRIEGLDTLHGLLPLEEKLLQAAARGESCRAGDRVLPDAPTDQNCVRGSFLRFLLLGGDGQAPVHEKGLELWEAFVDGDIDLENARAARPLLLLKCHIRGGLIGVNARLGLVVLSGSLIQDILCDGAHVAGRVFLRNGFSAKGEVRFPGAVIGGTLDCDGGAFRNAQGSALNCDQARIEGSVFLRDGFSAESQVSFAGAAIGGSLDCRKGVFSNGGGPSLNCDQARITGDALLNDGFSAKGEVRFLGAKICGQLNCAEGSFVSPRSNALLCDRAAIADAVLLGDGFTAQGAVRFARAEIGGDVLCGGGRFENNQAAPRSAGQTQRIAACALSFAGATILGRLWLAPAPAPYDHHVIIKGSLDLSGASALSFADHPESWPQPHILTQEHGGAPCVLVLDGFVYGSLEGGAPTGAVTRRKWLLRQPEEHLGENFRQQPFDQIGGLMRAMGRGRDAREIGFLKDSLRLRQARRRMNRRNPLVWLSFAAQWLLLQQGLGFGRRVHRMAAAAFFAFLGCGYIYDEAARQGLFAPTDPRVFLDASLKPLCSPPNGRPAWTSRQCQLGKAAPEYTVFDPYVYSLDVITPAIDLGQGTDWRPLAAPLQYNILGLRGELPHSFVRGLVWTETLFAWVWSLSLIAAAAVALRRG